MTPFKSLLTMASSGGRRWRNCPIASSACLRSVMSVLQPIIPGVRPNSVDRGTAGIEPSPLPVSATDASLGAKRKAGGGDFKSCWTRLL